ncbi:MAG: 4-hydroxy-3-methylbut-2-enyl diphosphate reductase, partial [Lachnospiraceae bacterium]|nr:4-hydroxy-3-methylbut-2-enyl diphosphate reductase [Lachnospiraceae bacterium]
EAVYEQIADPAAAPIFTYGHIIHNTAVVRDLENKGVVVIVGEEGLAAVTEGTVIIRAHGAPRRIHRLIAKKGLKKVDATCPYVRRIHEIVEKASGAGQEIIIAGSPKHPEVEGIIGWAESITHVIETPEEAAALAKNLGNTGLIVAQTTFNHNKFQDIVDIFAKRGYNGNVVNTICNATKERQLEAERIAKDVDVMFVIGDAHSSNTAKLYEICRKECADTYFVQTLKDLPLDLRGATTAIGITAGASTPNNIIEEVQTYARTKF